ncbi:MAG TPA: histidine phosphatase family protein [Actinomycetes bacterium]|nr:histidine phosphatase family protein [Actinomycetes bacterium]
MLDVTVVLLIRHGRTAANASGVLAGWTPGVELDERGNEQVAALAQRIEKLPIAAVVSSPLERCQQTANALVSDRTDTPIHLDDRLGEVRYGDWTGQPLKQLAKQPLWKTVQAHPSGVVFPGEDGEAMAAMQARSVGAVREWNTKLGADALYVVVSHGDVIKSILADALGQHLDQFQRIVVDPASLSVVRYGDTRPFVERVNDTGGSVAALLPPKRRRSRKKTDDAVVGGGAGA